MAGSGVGGGGGGWRGGNCGHGPGWLILRRRAGVQCGASAVRGTAQSAGQRCRRGGTHAARALRQPRPQSLPDAVVGVALVADGRVASFDVVVHLPASSLSSSPHVPMRCAVVADTGGQAADVRGASSRAMWLACMHASPLGWEPLRASLEWFDRQCTFPITSSIVGAKLRNCGCRWRAQTGQASLCRGASLWQQPQQQQQRRRRRRRQQQQHSSSHPCGRPSACTKLRHGGTSRWLFQWHKR